MAKHLSAEQITKYQERTLPPGELLAVDSHLGSCAECQAQMAAQSSEGIGFVLSISEAASQHLTYEQMEAWVEDQMDQTERELVMAHIGTCAECARQLKAYEGYAPVMSAPVNRVARQAAPAAAPAIASVPIRPAVHKPTFGERVHAFFSSPRMVAAMLTIAAVAIVTPIVWYRGQQSPSSGGGGEISSLENLPPEIREGAEAVARAQVAERPAALADLRPNSDRFLQYPVSEVIEDVRPELRWKPFASSYTVRLYNAQGMQIGTSDLMTTTAWLVPMALDRGATYSYDVVGLGDVHRAEFRVLSQSSQAEMARLRASRGNDHFVLGAVAQQFGMLTVAQHEFELFVRQRPQSAEAARMLSNVNSLIGR